MPCTMRIYGQPIGAAMPSAAQAAMVRRLSEAALSSIFRASRAGKLVWNFKSVRPTSSRRTGISQSTVRASQHNAKPAAPKTIPNATATGNY